MTPSVLAALEGILESLRRTISSSPSNLNTKTIVCQRYEYSSLANVIRSCKYQAKWPKGKTLANKYPDVGIIHFSVTECMRNINNAKKPENWVTYSLEYNECEADFDEKLWRKAADNIDEGMERAA